MFKVECPGCKAPYQVDERRIPSSGLKMRCPKCGTSFRVEQPADARRTGPSPVLGGALGLGESAPPPAVAPPDPSKGTMVGVAPPRPLQTDPAAYPAAARRMGVEGLVEVAFVVDEVGRPSSVELVRSASPPLDSAVLDAVRHWRFEPARKHGVPVKMRHSYRQQFVME